MPSMPFTLERDGYCVPPFTLDESECDELTENVRDIEKVGNRALMEHRWCSRLAERVRVGLSSSLPEIASLKPVQCTFFRKDEARNWLVSWHQDRSLPFDREHDYSDDVVLRQKDGGVYYQPSIAVLEQIVSVRVYLDASHADNGPLRMLTGTHLKGVLESDQIDSAKNTVEESMPEVARGGVLILRPLILHASSKSVCSDSRRVLHYVYR